MHGISLLQTHSERRTMGPLLLGPILALFCTSSSSPLCYLGASCPTGEINCDHRGQPAEKVSSIQVSEIQLKVLVISSGLNLSCNVARNRLEVCACA
jgi:hypothetical protein